MTYQPKVTNTQWYSDSQGEHIVAKGRLVLIDKSPTGAPIIGDLCDHGNNGYCIIKDSKHLEFANANEYVAKIPVIISELEEIEVGDKFTDGENIYTCSKVGKRPHKGYTYSIWDKNGKQWIEGTFEKVLATYGHFSDKQLQAIVDGKMKDGDDVLVKCKGNMYNTGVPPFLIEPDFFTIYLDKNNHITLFPAKQSLEEFAEEYANDRHPKERRFTSYQAYKNGIIVGAEWAKKNNY